MQGNYKKALELSLRAEQIVLRTGNKEKIASALLNVSGGYLNICKQAIIEKDSITVNYYYDRLITCLSQGLDISKNSKDTSGMAFFFTNLALAFDKCNLCEAPQLGKKIMLIRSNSFEMALKYYLQANELYEKINDKVGVSWSYSNLGLFYKNQGNIFSEKGKLSLANINYAKSLNNYLKSYKLIRVLGYKHGIANVSKDIGNVYLKLGRMDDAEKYMLNASIGFKEMGYKEGIKESYEILSKISLQTGNYKKALEYYKKGISVKDSLFNEAKSKQITEINTKYETEKKDDSLKIQNKNLFISHQTISSRNTLLGVITGGLAILIILLLILFRTYKRTKLAKDTIELLQKELHHRVTNNLAIITRLVEVAGKQTPENQLKGLENRIKSIAYLHDQLYKQNDLTKLNFQPFIQQLVQQINQSVAMENVVISNVQSEVDLETDKAIPLGLIINELVTNSYKYAFKETANPSIEMNIEKNLKKEIVFYYKDNGKGFNDTANSRTHTGYGMKLVKGLSSQLSGRVRIWNDNGFNFELIIP